MPTGPQRFLNYWLRIKSKDQQHQDDRWRQTIAARAAILRQEQRRGTPLRPLMPRAQAARDFGWERQSDPRKIRWVEKILHKGRLPDAGASQGAHRAKEFQNARTGIPAARILEGKTNRCSKPPEPLRHKAGSFWRPTAESKRATRR